jgi:ADP-heptose:LPS heptosyltransferase
MSLKNMSLKKMLVIRFGALGDLLHLSPALQTVKECHPDWEIHLLTGSPYQALGSALAGVDRVWTWDKQSGLGALASLSMELRELKFGAVVNLQPSLKSWLLTQSIWPKRQAAYHKQKLKQKGLAQRKIPRRHATADFYEPFRRVLDLPPVLTQLPSLVVPDDIFAKMPHKPVHERWIGIITGVGSKRANRAWGVEQYIKLIQELLEMTDQRILLIGGMDEQPLAELILSEIPGQSDKLQNHCGAYDILATAALLQQCDVVIGGDTGPLHLAAAVGAPIIAIYGPTALARTGPIGAQNIQTLTPPKDLACWPCELPQCPYTGEAHLACMKEIPGEMVKTMLVLSPD